MTSIQLGIRTRYAATCVLSVLTLICPPPSVLHKLIVVPPPPKKTKKNMETLYTNITLIEKNINRNRNQ